ncbi:MAG: class II aldolase/adducin family protein [Candidatus Verstraetearchaeota archaeon]|nr:class II aldolase/adducin family protein [Candidatus Verstraetearchaeota archaeon]
MRFKVEEIKKRLAECMRSLHARGLISGAGGNASFRVGEYEMLITPSGVYKGRLTERDIVRMTLDGALVEGHNNPSSEWRFHAEIYKKRRDVNAIVHAHSPYTTGLAISSNRIEPVTPEVALIASEVEIVGYKCPGTEELSRLIGERIIRKRALVLQNHGVVAVGRELEDALAVIEILEEASITTFVAKLTWGVKVIPEDEIEVMRRVYKR